MSAAQPERVIRLTGVYHADGGVLGELRYVVGKLRGVAHCALCDITHGALGKKRAFAAWQRALPVPFALVHLNERSPEVARVTERRTPALVAHTARRIVLLLGPDELELEGSLEAFRGALARALREQGLRL